MKKALTSIAALTFILIQGTAFSAEKIPQPPTENPYELLQMFASAFHSIRKDYVEPVNDRQLVEAAIDGMLSSLDPHSGYLNEESFKDMMEQTAGQFGGLGVEVTMENGLVKVISPMDDTPAFRAGLQPGDYFTHIDGVAVMGMTLNEAVEKMRGAPDTKITLTISRKDEKPFDVTMTREMIKVQSVKQEAKENIGYIRITTFSETTTDMTKKAVEDLKKKIGEKQILGYVIDLRNNPGGLLDQAIGVVDLFLEQGEIVSTRSRRQEENMKFNASTGDITNGLPLVVLINEGSASASEIVAGALQDHRRAVIVGTTSFGKGSVQTVSPLEDKGALRITTARYYTPSGRSIQAKGIEPDILIKQAKIEEVQSTLKLTEANLPGAISSQEGKKANETDPTGKNGVNGVAKPEDDKKEDYQLNRALDILTGISVYKQSLEETSNIEE